MPLEISLPTGESDDSIKAFDPCNVSVNPLFVPAFSNISYSFGYLGNENEFPSRFSSSVTLG